MGSSCNPDAPADGELADDNVGPLDGTTPADEESPLDDATPADKGPLDVNADEGPLGAKQLATSSS